MAETPDGNGKGGRHTPPLSRGSFSAPFERFIREDISDWTGAFTLLDTIETYFDSHVDLLQRKLQKHSDRLKLKAEGALQKMKNDDKFKIRELSGDFNEQLDRELKSFKLKISARMTTLSASWQSAKVVRTRDKVSFFLGVMSVLVSALMFGLAPQWVHVAYTAQAAYLLPLRWYKYKKRAWHYFLFDLCYYVTALNLIFIWFLPHSPALFVACYCLSHGSLGSAVITWRNSLVFHDSDKVTSLFIHIYPPFTFTVIKHFYPGSDEAFPALKDLSRISPWKALLLSGAICMFHYSYVIAQFLLVDRRAKIESGQRTTSFSFFLADKRSSIGRALASVPPRYRELSFMAGQFAYAILTELPAVFLFYDSPAWSGAFLMIIFAVSVWNGGGYYIEVFGRKFERELEALRKELEASGRSSGTSTPSFVTSEEGHDNHVHDTDDHSDDDSTSSVSAATSPSTPGSELPPSLQVTELLDQSMPDVSVLSDALAKKDQ
ncbi:hypothetical protein FISHEDRAFT_48524 [Fistulina hepatica ATCC 64428]|uniref:Glycerophosphocholine acyltransferase 1 n=1 Tax=Fistulina hepatica ATCC 64428 TaxID=1128425 RepID=A0A0D7A4K2_9AGAR|nr:hypothetical protein FISHEDRAFT_48524 [Fistulina hepatica ATCC 64428]